MMDTCTYIVLLNWNGWRDTIACLESVFQSCDATFRVIVCDNDLYFRAEDNQLEIEHIIGGELRVYESPWGHCVASPGNDPEFERYLDQALHELLD